MSNYYINPGLIDVKQYNGRTLPSNINIVKKDITPKSYEITKNFNFTGMFSLLNASSKPEPTDSGNSISSYNAKRGGAHNIATNTSYPTVKTGHAKKRKDKVTGDLGIIFDKCEQDPPCSGLNPPDIIQNPAIPPNTAPYNMPILDDSMGCILNSMLSMITAQLGSYVTIDVDCFLNDSDTTDVSLPGDNPNTSDVEGLYAGAWSEFLKLINNWKVPPRKPGRSLTAAEKNTLKNKFIKNLKAQWRLLQAAINGTNITVPIACASGCPQVSDGTAPENCGDCTLEIRLTPIYNTIQHDNKVKISTILSQLCEGQPTTMMVDSRKINQRFGEWLDIPTNTYNPPSSIPVIGADDATSDPENAFGHMVTVVGFECDNEWVYLICQDSYYTPDGTQARRFKIRVSKKANSVRPNIGIDYVDPNTGNYKKIVGFDIIVYPLGTDISAFCTGPAPLCDKDLCSANTDGCEGTCVYMYTVDGWSLVGDNPCGFLPGAPMPSGGALCICSEPSEFVSIIPGTTVAVPCTVS